MNNLDKRKNYVIFLAIISFCLSFVFLLGAFKTASAVKELNFFSFILCLALYLGTILIYNLYIARLINKGYFNPNNNKKRKVNVSLIMLFSVFGLVVGKLISNSNVGNDTAFTILTYCQVALCLAFILGTHNFIKYYVIVKLDN
ncbi:hypothetical protein [Vallitalea okinawensis]|uniref:hypothetical protein n=1 Tax=Vallitalea okinawensis TaxID=2078660 RepID=UPI001479064C|nr:hypothetical protein [Vallitalea okinawensis]